MCYLSNKSLEENKNTGIFEGRKSHFLISVWVKFVSLSQRKVNIAPKVPSIDPPFNVRDIFAQLMKLVTFVHVFVI